MRYLLVIALLAWSAMGCAEENTIVYEPSAEEQAWYIETETRLTFSAFDTQETELLIDCNQDTREVCFTFPKAAEFDHCIAAETLAGTFEWLGCKLEEGSLPRVTCGDECLELEDGTCICPSWSNPPSLNMQLKALEERIEKLERRVESLEAVQPSKDPYHWSGWVCKTWLCDGNECWCDDDPIRPDIELKEE